MNNTLKINEDKKAQETPSFLLPKSSSNKKTLVLDLDETLVHSQFQPFDVEPDILLKIELENELHDIHVMVRPGVQEFLENMGKIYEIVIFTASVSKYADPLLDIIDKNKNCKYRLFREHCTPINTCYVKELKKLGRELKNVIIVDNSPMSYALNPENGIPIITWFDDKTDRELYNISSILEFLSFVPDVRNYINQFIINDEISYTNVINVFDKYNKMLTNEKNKSNVNEENICNICNINTGNNSNTITNNDKDKNVKRIFNKNNSKTKFKNKEKINNNNNNINKNIISNKFKKNLTLNNIKQKDKDKDKDKNDENNKKIKQISKNPKSKSKQFNPKNIIANIDKNENNENMSPNITNQTTKNKTTKNINFNPSTIIAGVPMITVSNALNNSLIPNTAKNKINVKNNTHILKHRKCDSYSGLRFPKKIQEKNSLVNININSNNKMKNNLLHSYSIISNNNSNKSKKIFKSLNSNCNDFNIINSSTNIHTTKNKNNKNIQLSMRLSHDLTQELKKLEQSLDLDEKTQKKLSKSLTKEKITITSSKNKINTGNYNTNTYSNKSNYIYHKKNKSINTSFIPFPSSTKNTLNKSKIKIGIKYSKNSFNKNNNTNHRRYLSSSESFGINTLKGLNMNNVYSTNTTNSNHSSIIGFTNSFNGNSGNIFLNNLTSKSKQRNIQKKMEINVMKTDRVKYRENKENKENKENMNPNNNINVFKKKEKIPFNFNNKKRKSANENSNAFKKKIPISGTNKNNLKMDINNNIKIGFHKKNMSYNPEILGLISIRPKSSKQMNHIKKDKINFKIDINKRNMINVNKNNNINNIENNKTDKNTGESKA